MLILHLCSCMFYLLITHICSFESLWIIDLESGFVREVIKGMGLFFSADARVNYPCASLTCDYLKESSKILEICGQMIRDKCNPLKQLPALWLEKQVKTSFSFEGIPYAGLMSSIATCQDHVVFCDAGI